MSMFRNILIEKKNNIDYNTIIVSGAYEDFLNGQYTKSSATSDGRYNYQKIINNNNIYYILIFYQTNNWNIRVCFIKDPFVDLYTSQNTQAIYPVGLTYTGSNDLHPILSFGKKTI